MTSLMDSIGSRLDEARDTGRYLVGLLVFLGLLGTFWGLLETITSVGQTISTLNTKASESAMVFCPARTVMLSVVRIVNGTRAWFASK